jgi:hypothetical protein
MGQVSRLRRAHFDEFDQQSGEGLRLPATAIQSRGEAAAPQMSDPGPTVDNGPVATDLLDDSASTGSPTNTPRVHDTMTTIEAFREHLAAVDPRIVEVTHP